MKPDVDRRSRVRWALIFWTFLVAAVSYLDRANISVAASAIQADFGLSNVQLGTVFSAFGIGYAIAQPFAGRAADRFGPRRLIFAASLWWAAFTALTALVPAGIALSLTTLMIVRFMLGLGESVIFPASNRLVASWLPQQERGLANGIIFAGVGFGAGIAPPLFTHLILAFDWHVAFYASAVIGIAVGIGWYVSVRDQPHAHARVNRAEIDYIRDGLPEGVSSGIISWRYILRDRQVALLSASYFTFGYVAYIFFTWFFKYLSTVRGLDLKTSAVYATLPFIAMSLGAPLGGVVCDRLTRRFDARIGRCLVPGLSLLCAASFVAAATQVADARLAAVVLAGGAFALYFSTSSFWTLSANIGGTSAGSVAGFMNMANQIGGVITASLTAVLADSFGWTVSFVVAAILCGIGGLLWLFIDPHHRIETQPQP